MQVISGVNNSAFFAQSAYSASTASYDVNGYPITSYLPESGVGYNAVNEVSALNGSAIAQYGAEKQFLVHDDTLCHLSNSAQFALGVNLSAVAQLLGEYPISITESGAYTLNSTYVSGTSYLYWYYLSNGMCRIKGQLRPTTAMPATWHAVQIATNGASALLDNTFIPTVIDWEGWADYLSWFSDGTLNFNSREVSPTAASRLIYVDYLGIPKR